MRMVDVIEKKRNGHVLTDEEKTLLNDYNEARKNKDFAKADEYRKVLIEKKLL